MSNITDTYCYASVTKALSHPRIDTYQRKRDAVNRDDPAVIELYLWNAKISAEFLFPLHILEVVYRNAISDALASSVGSADWPYKQGFLNSLPNIHKKYLSKQIQKYRNPNQLIPELKLAFWQSMLTARNDGAVWSRFFWDTFPNADRELTIGNNRTEIYQCLEIIRKLRNRIAHFEPIFYRDLQGDYDRILTLIDYRCTETSRWLDANQGIAQLLGERPF